MLAMLMMLQVAAMGAEAPPQEQAYAFAETITEDEMPEVGWNAVDSLLQCMDFKFSQYREDGDEPPIVIAKQVRLRCAGAEMAALRDATSKNESQDAGFHDLQAVIAAREAMLADVVRMRRGL